MSWSADTDLSAFTAQVRPVLHADPVLHTLPLTILGDLEAGRAISGSAPVYLTHRDDRGARQQQAAVDGVALMTPPHPLVLAGAPDADGLVACLIQAGHSLSGVNGPPDQAHATAQAWIAATGARVATTTPQHLLLLGVLIPPLSPPSGYARRAETSDTALMARWFTEFAAEVHDSVVDGHTMASRRIAQGNLWCWCLADDEPVAMAAYSPPIVGVSRIGPVYTPPARRRAGYAAAVTAAATVAAQQDGALQVCLFTDAANRTSNAVYERLGYRRVSARVVIAFGDPE